MNCQNIQRRLFSLPNPERVPASVRAHLAECRPCRETQRQLAQIERHVPLLTVPSSSFAKAAMLRRIRSGPTFRERVGQYLERVPVAIRGMGPRSALVAGLAAALLMVVVGWRLSSGPDGGAPLANKSSASGRDALLANVLDRDLRLARASKAQEQVENLANLADDLQGAARPLARAPEGKDALRDLAGWYGQVVQKEVKRAGSLPLKERGDVLAPLAQRLEQAAAKTDSLAQEVGAADEHPLRSLAAAAREGKSQLDTLIGQQAFLPARRGHAVRMRAPLASIGLGMVVLGARTEESTPLPIDEARRLQLNHGLLKVVVEGSLALADEEDRMKRAVTCGRVARGLADAIRTAASENEGPRVDELGRHLRDQLQRGVADNLEVASRSATVDGEMLTFATDMVHDLQPIEELHSADPETQDHLHATLKAMHEGQAEIERVLKGRNLTLKPGKQKQSVIQTVP